MLAGCPRLAAEKRRLRLHFATVNRLGGVQIDRDGDASPWIVRLTGEHDLATVDALREQFSDVPDAGPLVIDLSDTVFLDSSILGVIVEAHSRIADAGGRFGLVVPEGSFAARLVELAGLSDRLPVYRSRAEAVAAT
jgi:anti-anti-sigma factor